MKIRRDYDIIIIPKSKRGEHCGRNVITAERDLVTAENAILKDKVVTLTAENDMLKMELKRKDEIIALHNYYNKLKPNN